MFSVDLRAVLSKLNPYCTTCLEAAAGLCVGRSHRYVYVEHFLLKLLDGPTADVQTILRSAEIEPSRLQKSLQHLLDQFPADNAGRPILAPELIDWIQESWMLASVELGLTEIRSAVLLAALVRHPERCALEREPLQVLDLSAEGLRKRLFELIAGSTEEGRQEDPRFKDARGGQRSADSALSKFTIDFTARARAGDIDPVFCRDREIQRMIHILGRRRKNNPILVGEAGVGKTAAVEGLALRIASDDVPDILKNVDLLGLDLGLLQAGAGIRGEFEERLKSVISEVQASPRPIILFIDEVHTLIGAGAAAGSSDAANLLKPALARGELRTIAATTWSEYSKYFEKDAALARRFQRVALNEPSEQDAIAILRGLREVYERSHNVRILDEAVVAAARLSSRYLSGRQLPDKAVDVLDTAAAKVKIGLTSRPESIDLTDRSISVLERELAARRRDEASGVEIDLSEMVEIEQRIARQRMELVQLEERWRLERGIIDSLFSIHRGPTDTVDPQQRQQLEASLKEVRDQLRNIQGSHPLMKAEVDAGVVAEVISDWTGIPVGKMIRNEAKDLLSLEETLRCRIKGQDHALRVIADGIREAKTGVGKPNAPLGVFLLAGSSGVGKTETALCVADLLFGGERFLITINMNEFQEKHAVARLIGAPPGYVGYEEGGVLTEAVRQRPYSVILLDEIEKSHADALNIFYQAFERGMLSDSRGRQVDFKNTIFFLTTNLGAEAILARCRSRNRPTPEELFEAITPHLASRLKPEFLGRLTTVPYYPIEADTLKEITVLKLEAVSKRLADSHRLRLEYDPAVIMQIATRCKEVHTGARNIDHIVQRSMLPQISRFILERAFRSAMPANVKVDISEEGEFQLAGISSGAETVEGSRDRATPVVSKG